MDITRYQIYDGRPNGFLVIKYENYLGVIDSNRNLIIEPRYTYIGDFSEGLIIARLSENYGYLDATGKVRIPFLFRSATDFRNGKAIVTNEKGIFIINKEGKKIKKLKNYEKISEFVNGYARVYINGNYGFIDEDGSEICKIQYESAEYFDRDVAKVQKDNRWGLINKNGKLLVKCRYQDIGILENGLYKVWKYGGLYSNENEGLLDRNGIKVLPTKYQIHPFRNGMSKILSNVNSKFGYINNDGIKVIPNKYDDADDFIGGKAKVRLKDKYYFIDKKGTRIGEAGRPDPYFTETPSKEELESWTRNAMNGY